MPPILELPRYARGSRRAGRERPYLSGGDVEATPGAQVNYAEAVGRTGREDDPFAKIERVLETLQGQAQQVNEVEQARALARDVLTALRKMSCVPARILPTPEGGFAFYCFQHDAGESPRRYARLECSAEGVVVSLVDREADSIVIAEPSSEREDLENMAASIYSFLQAA